MRNDPGGAAVNALHQTGKYFTHMLLFSGIVQIETHTTKWRNQLNYIHVGITLQPHV